MIDPRAGDSSSTIRQWRASVTLDRSLKIGDPWSQLAQVAAQRSVIPHVPCIEPHGPIAAVVAAHYADVGEFPARNVWNEPDGPVLIAHRMPPNQSLCALLPL